MSRPISVRHGQSRHALRVSNPDPEGWSQVLSTESTDGTELRARLEQNGDVLVVEREGSPARLATLRSGRGVWVAWRGRTWYLQPAEAATSTAAAVTAKDEVRAPMTGVLLEVRAGAGRRVARDELLAVLEAMKMEYRLVAPRDGEVAEVAGAPGDRVELGQLVVRLRPAADDALVESEAAAKDGLPGAQR